MQSDAWNLKHMRCPAIGTFGRDPSAASTVLVSFNVGPSGITEEIQNIY